MSSGIREPIQLQGMIRQAQRAPINPLDKSSVISIFPRPITSVKETTQPAQYEIPAGSPENPAILTVGSASWWRNILDMPSIEIPISSPIVAKSIVDDYCIGLLGYSMNVADPGLFWLLGEVTALELKTKYKAELEAAVQRQKNWYRNLIERADIDWARSNGNPRAVNELQRLAAEKLGLAGKAWMENSSTMELINCPACGVLKNPKYPICANCSTNVEEFLAKRK